MKSLRLEDVTGGYGETAVVWNVDLSVPAGKTVALLGANGAGKSTLLKLLAGIIRPFSGAVWLDNRRIEGLPPHTRAQEGLCLIPEGHAIFRGLTVKENLAMYCGGRRLPEAIDRTVAAFPRLGDRLGQEAGTLSGGEQQMLALSRALILDAQIVLADELSMGLAPVIVDEIFEVIERFQLEGCSLLIVEQFVARALAVADYVYILHKGRVVFVGEPQQCENERLFEQYLGSVA